MRFLLISDIHGDALSLEKLLERERAVDCIIVSGDLTDFEEAGAMQRMISLLRAPGLPVLAVPGNCDRRAARAALESSGFCIDNRSRRVDFRGQSVNFFGMGGGGFRTGFTPYERREDEFERIFASCPACGSGLLPLIIVTHTPPRDTEADLRQGAHVGSPSLASALARIQPGLWVCGHIHEARSVSSEGRTLLVNPGSLREGFYGVASFEQAAAESGPGKAGETFGTGGGMDAPAFHAVLRSLSSLSA